MTQIPNYLPSPDMTQSVSASSTGTAAAATSSAANYLVEMITDLVIGLESQASTGTGTSAATVLPGTSEPASSTAGVSADALALMGDAVGLGMASASTAVDWQGFVQQTTQQLSAAGFSPNAIDTYLGAVMQSYTEAAQSGNSALGVETQAIPFTSPLDVGPAVVSPASVSVSTARAPVNIASTSTSASSYAIVSSQLPSKQVAATQFTDLAKTAFNQAAPSLGSQVNINLFISNTQTEMTSAGYSQDQINNYMTGLYTAYNASPAGALPSSNTASTITAQQPVYAETTYNDGTT